MPPFWRSGLRSALSALPLCGFAIAAAAQSDCGPRTTVQRGDTISHIAARCDVSESAVLAANPRVDGSADLQVGHVISLVPRTGGDRIGTELGGYARQAGDALGRFAGQVGSSVQDLLDRNPDLKARLDRLGGETGLSSGASGPSATVTPSSGAPGSTVTVSATGLAPDSPVEIAAGPPGAASETVGEARSSGSGSLSANVAVPAWASGPQLVYSLRRNGQVLARTGRLDVSR